MDNRPRHLSLFSGAGGGEYAARILDWRTVCYVERAAYCQQVIQARIRDGVFCDAPIWDDVCTFDGRPWRGLVDVLSAGFPCQPFSVAGLGLGVDDDRNGWPDTARIIREIRPRFALLENVPNLTSGSHGYYGTVLGDLAALGYDAAWGVLSAQDCGAPHIRKRLWILASEGDVADADRRRRGEFWEQDRQPGHQSTRGNEPHRRGSAQLADSDGTRRGKRRGAEPMGPEHAPTQCGGREGGWWDTDPAEGEAQSRVGQVVDGMAHRRDRLRATGNGQVPIVAAVAWHQLMEARRRQRRVARPILRHRQPKPDNTQTTQGSQVRGNRNKARGSGYEREIVQIIQDLALPAHRVPLSGAMAGYRDDVVVCDRWRVEVKYRQKAAGFSRLHGWRQTALASTDVIGLPGANLFRRPIGLHLVESGLVVYSLIHWVAICRAAVDGVDLDPILVTKKVTPQLGLLGWLGEADALALRRPRHPWVVCVRDA